MPSQRHIDAGKRGRRQKRPLVDSSDDFSGLPDIGKMKMVIPSELEFVQFAFLWVDVVRYWQCQSESDSPSRTRPMPAKNSQNDFSVTEPSVPVA